MKGPVVLGLSVLWCWCVLQVCSLPDEIYIGGLFDSDDELELMAFSYAIERVNADNTLLPLSELRGMIKFTNDDSFQATKDVCGMMSEGVAAIFGPRTENTANHVQSICEAMKVPHIETRWQDKVQEDTFSINLHPYSHSLSQSYQDILVKLNWKKFVILYDSNDSLVRIQSLLKYSKKLPGTSSRGWDILVRKLNENGDYRPMLKEIRRSNINSLVIDVSQEKIPSVLHQADTVGLMTDYHRYFITSLDFNQVNLEPFRASGTNITGIQLVDPKRSDIQILVGELYNRYNRRPRLRHISTNAALIYDAVYLFADALTQYATTHQVEINKLYCETDKSWQHGKSFTDYIKMYNSPSSNYGGRYLPPHPSSSGYPWMTDSRQLGGQVRGGIMTQGRGGPGPLGGFMTGSYYNNMTTVPQHDQVRLVGFTGPIKFNNMGHREDFQIDILEFEKGTMKKIGTWSLNTGTNYTRSWAEAEEALAENLRGRNMKVCIALTKPYTMLKPDADMRIGNDKYEGFCVDLINEIAKDQNFNVTFMISPDGQYGSPNNDTGKWNGIIGQLLDHKADLGIVDLTITHKREEAVDFTMPFMNLGISIIFKKPIKKPAYLFSFMSPFSLDVWVFMATAYLGVSVLLFLLARMAPDEWDCPYPCIENPEELENSFTLLNSMWFIIGTFLCQGADIAPKAVSTRIVASIWWFFTLIMISSYTANLAAFLTAERMVSAINSVDDLAKQTEIKYGCKKGGSTYAFFQENNIPTYKKMWQTMSSTRPSVFTEDNKQGVERVQKSDGMYAFLMESSSIEYEVERKCDLMMVGDLLDSKSYGIALPPDSPYTNTISGSILMLKEKGVLHNLKLKYWIPEEGACQKEEKGDAASAAELGLENVGGVFVVMIGGICLAFIVACCEFAWKARKLATDDGVSFIQELRKELLFVISCRENAKPVRKRTLPPHTDSSSIYGSSNYGYSEKN